jgi:type IV pilus assembly protein PilV
MTAIFRQSGFTLLELVIAMALFTIGLMGLMLMSSGLMTHNMSSRQRAIATQLAQNKLEMLSRSEYTDITDSLEQNLDVSGVSGGGVFEREVVVEEKAGPACKEVAVIVSWRSRGEHRVVVKTILGM